MVSIKHRNLYPKQNILVLARFFKVILLLTLLCIYGFLWNLDIEMEGVQYLTEKAQDIELVSHPEAQNIELVSDPERVPASTLSSVSGPGNGASTIPTKTVPGVIVLGMHRSGTSMLTGLLSEIFSLKTPGKQVTATIYKSQNPKGFFENKDVARQNDVWLKAQDMRWDNLGMVTGINNSSEVSGGFDAFRSKSIGKYGKAALSEYNNNENWPWVLKDPRLCLTFTKWLPFLEGASPPILFTYRNPLDAARSLFERKRNSVPLLDGLKLWIWYNRESLRLSAGMCRVITR